MKKFHLNVGGRLALGFAMVLVLLVLVAMFSLSRLGQMHAESNLTLEDRYPKIVAITQIKDNLNLVAGAMRNVLLLQEQAAIGKEMADIEVARRVIAERLAYLEQHIVAAEGRALMGEVLRVRASYIAALETFTVQVRGQQMVDARHLLLGSISSKQRAYFDALDALATFQARLMAQAGDDVTAAYASGVMWIALLLAASVLSGIVIAWRIARSVTAPLRAAVRIAQSVAAGDLTTAVVVTTSDETGRLLQALKEMNDGLLTIVGEVRGGTDTIATASRQIASGNLDLSARTEQQASSLEQTASAMEQLTATVEQNADNARQAHRLAAAARTHALKGGDVVGQVVATMQAINVAGNRIADIVGVIDGIAFQTNILALNAAVEAARAGEQGRGFAVVATEVRNLAQRSAAAASDVTKLIGESVARVDTGMLLVGQAGATMQDIVDSINRVTQVMSEITAASQEQATGIQQINQAIVQMDEVTQQNAALVEEAAAATSALQDQAGTLSQVVSVFKLASAPVATRATMSRRLA